MYALRSDCVAGGANWFLPGKTRQTCNDINNGTSVRAVADIAMMCNVSCFGSYLNSAVFSGSSKQKTSNEIQLF